MQIQQKQFNLLNKLLKDHSLKKSIEDITVFEASIIIEGLLNNGTVKKEHNGRLLSSDDYRKKQLFFLNLVELKQATNKQMSLIHNLSQVTDYRLIVHSVPQKDVNMIINFLKEGKDSSIASKYFKKIEKKALITKKEVKSEKGFDFPDDWVMLDIVINGYIDF